MTLRRVYQSDPVLYAPQDLTKPVFGTGGFLREDPRTYDETLSAIMGVYIERDPSISGRSQYGALMQMRTATFPGGRPAAQFWDWQSGATVDHDAGVAGVFTWGLAWLWYSLTSYIATTTRNEFFRLGLGSSALTPVDRWANRTGADIPATHWEGTYKPSKPLAVSIEYDWLVASSWEPPLNTHDLCGPWLHVYRWSDGARLRSFSCLGAPIDIFPEDGYFVWVICNGGYLQLVDVRTGSTASVMRVDFETPEPKVRGVYDRYQRRLLLLEQTADAADGAATTRLLGYWPNELPRRISAPVPLERVRVGQRTRFVTRCVGDMGLPMPGVEILANSTGDSTALTVATARMGTDVFGYAVGLLEGQSEGLDVLNVEASV